MTVEKAYAKLNISLDVSRAREDGYHDMLMVMQSVSLADELKLELNGSGSIKASCNLPYIPRGDDNLAVKAVRLLLEKTSNGKLGADIRIEKTIPVGAGMAGGSTDAAAAIRACNRELGSPLGESELLELAAKTGSDVPFCLIGGTALAQGRGELLTELPDFPDCCFVIAKPEFSISTPEFFRALDSIKLRMHPDTDGIISALEAGDLKNICRRMYNVFEDVPDRRLRAVSEIKSALSEAGSLGAIMTGTGSAVFGIFEKDEGLDALVSQLKKEYGFACKAKPQKRERIR